MVGDDRTLGERSPERGAAVFIVMLVLTMLTAIGIFAMRAASLSGAASGYERQATQNQAVAECGLAAVVGELASDRRDAYMQKLLAGADKCLSAPAQAADGGTVPCYRVYANDFGANPCALATRDGGALESDFMVELTDPGPAGIPMAGSDQGSGRTFRYLQVTMTGTGQVRPSTGAAGDRAAVAGNAMNRAYIVVGPLP